ncbi:MAG: 6-phosphofructokinase [Aerococcus sp.]|nr:6-phosphofructokinase [Aerococcus sp.]
MSKRIAILTSGGDAPGMNAAIRAVVRKVIHDGNEAWGVWYGFRGLAHGNMRPLKASEVSNISSRGGTMLYTARYPEFAHKEGQQKAIEQLEKNKIDGLVVIGGDGSYHGALALTKLGFPTVGLPGTIDNDISGTDYTIGFDTACNTALESLDKLRDTARSHARTFVVEVMGRNAGDIALWSGMGIGADQIIVPESDFDMDEVTSLIDQGYANGKKHHMIVLAEGAMSAAEFEEKLNAYPKNYHVRTVVLGHVQRGGAPSAKDRVLASVLGYSAAEYVQEGKGGVCFGIRNNQPTYTPIEEALKESSTNAQANAWLDHINNEISFWAGTGAEEGEGNME